MSISRNIISFLIALSVFSMSFAPAPVYSNVKVNQAPERVNTGMVTLILANHTTGVITGVLNGTTTKKKTVLISISINQHSQTQYQLEAGKYKGTFYGCNNLTGKASFDLRGEKRIKARMSCPSQNKPPHKIWIGIVGR